MVRARQTSRGDHGLAVAVLVANLNRHSGPSWTGRRTRWCGLGWSARRKASSPEWRLRNVCYREEDDAFVRIANPIVPVQQCDQPCERSKGGVDLIRR